MGCFPLFPSLKTILDSLNLVQNGHAEGGGRGLKGSKAQRLKDSRDQVCLGTPGDSGKLLETPGKLRETLGQLWKLDLGMETSRTREIFVPGYKQQKNDIISEMNTFVLSYKPLSTQTKNQHLHLLNCLNHVRTIPQLLLMLLLRMHLSSRL